MSKSMNSNFCNYLIILLAAIGLSSCAETRIHDKEEWGTIFNNHGVQDGCFIVRDHTHESIYFYNKERCLTQYTPASTFKIFNSLVALDIPVAADDQFIIAWDSVERWNPDWNQDMTLRQAFRVSNVGYFQELARRIDKDYMQHYLDTVQYGNRQMGNTVDQFWLDNSLKISADEQVGLIKKLYFDELPFAERSQRIVRSMMLQEQTDDYKLYYKTGTAQQQDSMLYWVVGYVERIERYKEHEKSMNKSDIRNYPYFFAMNFQVARADTSRNWFNTRIILLQDLLREHGALPYGDTTQGSTSGK